jgi:hypothetical protein
VAESDINKSLGTCSHDGHHHAQHGHPEADGPGDRPVLVVVSVEPVFVVVQQVPLLPLGPGLALPLGRPQ